jgi:hypothetical protein
MTVNASGVASYVIERSRDLSTWTPVLTNGTSPFEYSDATAPNAERGFFRVRQD